MTIHPRFLLVCAALWGATLSVRAQTVPDPLAGAEQAMTEKSYAHALELLRAAKAGGREPERVQYDMALALWKTQKWDEAIAAASEGAKTAAWKARFEYLLGLIYVQAPHNAWKVGDKTLRQNEYPVVKNGETPQQISLYASDQKAALAHMEAAKVLAEGERRDAKANRYFAPIYPLAWDEECDLNLDLAAFLPQVSFEEFIQTLDKHGDGPFDEALDVGARYSTGWSLPKKVLFLYRQTPTLDEGEGRSKTGRALLGEGLFLGAYHSRTLAWATRYDAQTKKTIVKPFPFQSLDPDAPLRGLVDTFPASPLAPQTLVSLAQRQPSAVKQRAVWLELARKYPKSKWANDARAAIRDIERREVSFSVLGVAKPGEKPQLQVQSRNVKEVFFAAYRVKLEDFLLADKPLQDAEATFTSFPKNFGSIGDLTAKLGAPVARWMHKTEDAGNYSARVAKLAAPITDLGAYVVVASAGKVRFGQIVVVSDLALLKKSDVKSAFVWACDARTGAKVPGAHVTIKETWWDDNHRKVSIARGATGTDGFFDKTRAANNPSNFAAFAHIGNRYAFTGDQNYGGYGYWGHDSQNQPKVLGYTDRPVYRPGQTVHFRFVATNRTTGNDRKPLVGRKFFITANDARGAKLWEGEATTGEFGSLSGEFKLLDSSALGACSLSISDDDRISSQAGFRVEEYKRPEFEVTVAAPKDVKKPGETVEARLSARYYFGAPVPNAHVKYTVRKSVWYSEFRFPSPYDWLTTAWGMDSYGNRRNIGSEGSGEIVFEGTTTTDAQGAAKIAFKTSALDAQPQYVIENGWWRGRPNPLYTVEAEITDSSRRTIEAQGQVKVANQAYFAFLNTSQGYAQKGDRVPVELRTQDANAQPVAASGVMRVFRLLPSDKEEKLLEQPISTDATGRATWTWEARDSGQFRIEFEGQSEWGDKPKAALEAWVVGENVGQIRLRGVTILLDKPAYEEGQTLHARLVADTPGASVLFTQEANGQILKRDIIQIGAPINRDAYYMRLPSGGQSVEVSIPIDKSKVPNFFLGAALVQDYEVFQAQTEVIVPPTRQLLTLDVKGDKATYKPGETGTFHIRARDWSGQPARAEVSLALVDASLFYIQADTTPDARSFFYGDRRGNSVNLDSSRSGNIEARSETPPEPNIERHGWELPDDFGQLQLMPGGFGYYGYHDYNGYAFNGSYSRSARMSGGVTFLHARGRNNYLADTNGITLATPAAAPRIDAQLAAKSVAGGGAPDAEPVRSNFAETAFWSPAVVTNGGEATVKVTFPDSLTQWHATARGLTNSVQVGSAESDAATKKDLIVRLQAPRFFVEGDQVTISANVHNYSDRAQTAQVAFGFDGLLGNTPAPQSVTLAAGEEKRVDTVVTAAREGKTTISASARTATDSDAVKLSFPVLTHGAPQFAAHAGVIAADGTTTIPLTFPGKRQFGASQLNVQLNPSLAATALDALPYLADYPYGCVEQTMSRFLPSALVERSLKASGVNLETLRARAAAYKAEAQTKSKLGTVKNSGYSFPKGEPNARDLDEMASHMWWYDGHGRSNPIYDAKLTAQMTREGMQKLASMQRDDGGWGWFPGASQSDEWISAYVVYGLSQAKRAGIGFEENTLSRGRDYLRNHLKDEDNLQLLAYMTYALSQDGSDSMAKSLASGRLFTQRERLAPLAKCYLAMTLARNGETDKANVVVRNLENTVRIDADNGTARYQTQPDYWLWWNNDVETVALALRAFDEIAPDNKLVPMFAKWLTLNSRGNHWRSTKETAEVVYTLAQYVARHRELDVDMNVQVSLNGKLARTYHVTADNALWFDNRFRAGDLFLESGAAKNTLTITKTGRGKLYFSAYEDSFSREDPIKGSGNELSVGRTFYKLTRAETKPAASVDVPTTGSTAAKVAGRAVIVPFPPQDYTPPAPEYKREEIKDGASVKSGDLIEVELVVNARNDYEYLVFEDMKAAGFEPVDIRSGYDYSNGLGSYVEMRDDKTAFFVSSLPQGRRVLRYRVRAEAPGQFHALPTNGYAVYAPEIRATSDEMRVGVGVGE